MGHRYERDKRITTHIGLVARAFGVDGIVIGDISDQQVKESIIDVVERFGGDFSIEMGEKSIRFAKNWVKNDGEIIHLTAYGLPLPEIIEEIRSSQKDKLIIVGASKVPREVYELASHNVSITNQPHSEIAALAIFLDYLFQGKEFEKKFEKAKVEIIPLKAGKMMREVNNKKE